MYIDDLEFHNHGASDVKSQGEKQLCMYTIMQLDFFVQCRIYLALKYCAFMAL